MSASRSVQIRFDGDTMHWEVAYMTAGTFEVLSTFETYSAACAAGYLWIDRAQVTPTRRR